MDTPGNLKRNILISLAACAFVHLFFIRSIFVFIPAYALVLFLLWKKGGGDLQGWEEDDPADWWKKEQKQGEQ